tara:strand:- start:500 stop:1516 length:1017 start_codon:yes stop_codon:yes gene_type:complete
MKSNFRILGAGVWGLVFSDYLLELNHNVEVFCRDVNQSNKKLKDLNVSNLRNIDIKPLDTLDGYKGLDVINIIATNSKGFYSLLSNHLNYFNGISQLVSLTKGVDHKSGMLFSDKIATDFGEDLNYGLISGPSFAKDLSYRKKISVSFACSDKQLSDVMIKSTKSDNFEMIATPYVYHIEIAGIIKNIAAIVCALADNYFGKGKYTNYIIKKACDEIWQMSYEHLHESPFENDNKKLNDYLSKDREKIITSPGYIGDMILTCKQNQSRNYQFGNLISQSNISVEQAKNNIGTVEGYDCCITLVENSLLKQGELTNLLYKIIKCKSDEHEKLLKDFLQV